MESDWEGLKSGSMIGAYRIEDEVGEGGMGRVFRARREPEGETVALKVIKRTMSVDPGFRKRFLREARAAGEVSHPNLVGVSDAGEEDDRPFLTMPFIEGESLAGRIDREGPLPIETTVGVVAQIGAGLDALHAGRLIHRDVKPANIMLNHDGDAFLTDFGLARGKDYSAITRPGRVLGTVAYLAPELIRGGEAEPPSDVYALGCVAYHCLAGEPPYSGGNVFALGMAVLEEPPPDPCAKRPELGGSVSRVVRAALDKEPKRRPASAGDFSRQLALAADAAGR